MLFEDTERCARYSVRLANVSSRFGMQPDELLLELRLGSDGFGGPANGCIRDACVSQPDVARDGSREQVHILEHQAKLDQILESLP